MNKAKLKKYAPKARLDFIQAVTDKARLYGLSEDNIDPVKVEGDYAIINGKAWPKVVAAQREALEERISEIGFDQVIEEIAYTWFNRFAAIRYMELHNFLSHGYRVLSNPDPEKSVPEILEKAQYVDLPGLDKETVIELKMDGTKDAELYRKLLLAQCHQLNKSMPFLFEPLKDYTELLLPNNLLHSDSLIRNMVEQIDEQDFQQVEIIGWLYQFYISERKSELMSKKKAYESKDIPPVTQLFTPDWIVKYMVQNSLGAKWLQTYPESSLKDKMEYYIEPARQTEQVQKQLAEITPDSLNAEELTLLDPACGSGHILVEAYELLKEIYLERGYRKRDVAELILKKNLFGLEIDDRAAQLSGFSLMMKARADDRRIFEKGIQPNVVAIQETKELDVKEIVRAINAPLTEKDVDQSPASLEELQTAIEAPLFAGKGRKKENLLDDQEKLTVDDLQALLGLFEDAKTFGSLIRIPESLADKLPAIAARVNTAYKSDNLAAYSAAQKVLPFIKQALIMAGKYDAVVANPPYMGRCGMNETLKDFAKEKFPASKSDLCTMFMETDLEWCKQTGIMSMINLPSWMFLSSFEQLRNKLIVNNTIESLLHIGRGVFGSDFGTVAFSISKYHIKGYRAVYRRLFTEHVKVDRETIKLRRFFDRSFGVFTLKQTDLKKIPGSPIVYWTTTQMRNLFTHNCIGNALIPKFGMSVGNGERFIRYWQEVNISKIGFNCDSEELFGNRDHIWAPLDKGGEFRKWCGNMRHIVFWANNGRCIRNCSRSAVRNPKYFFRLHFSWTLVSSGPYSARYFPDGFLLDTASNCVYFHDNNPEWPILAFLNSNLCQHLLGMLNPTINYSCGVIGKLPALTNGKKASLAITLIKLAKEDWNFKEISWDFQKLPLLEPRSSLPKSYETYRQRCRKMTSQMKELEEENNRLFIEAYGLEDELTPEVPEEEITLFANPKYRYGSKLSEDQLEERFRTDTIKELISYSVGCMMGRYSLDEPGLIYAHSANEGFDPGRYRTFPADDDGVIPITELEWFEDDITARFVKFIRTVWGEQSLHENLEFIAQSLGQRKSETPRETIRRYFTTDFFKDHLRTYKKRPIYWLFTSGKKRGFQALVYLHRYNEATLARMRTEYVIPLQRKIEEKIKDLEKDKEYAGSTSEQNRIQKLQDKLIKQSEEIKKFEEKLRHYADKKIKLDLDGGVKANYGKFGDLLAEVKSVTGKKAARNE